MLNTIITHLQIFGIGFSFGIAGPCFLVCTPILITYIVGRDKEWAESFADISIFLFGRLIAYVALGALAGLSGIVLRRFTEANLARYINPLGGAVCIILGVLALFYRDPGTCCRKSGHNKIYDAGSLLLLGFAIGVSPCAPLIALLFEIALMSKSVIEGAGYALSFGLGTFLSGLIVVGALAGILKGFTRRIIHSRTGNIVFRVICAILLVALGVGMIFSRKS